MYIAEIALEQGPTNVSQNITTYGRKLFEIFLTWLLTIKFHEIMCVIWMLNRIVYFENGSTLTKLSVYNDLQKYLNALQSMERNSLKSALT